MQRENVSIRTFDVSSLEETRTLFVSRHISRETYYRLLAPDILSESYRRVIYLDSDTIVLTDLAELIGLDLEGYYLAAVRDAFWIHCYREKGVNRTAFEMDKLDLNTPDNYFNAGVLVMNLPLLRREFPRMALMDLATRRSLSLHDQDVLNIICDGGKALLLHPQWNELMNRTYHCLPPEMQQQFREGHERPKIVHYAGGEKPWNSIVYHWEEFWRTAAKTPFYQEILSRLLRYKQLDNSVVVDQFSKGKAGLRCIMKCFIAWVNAKIKGLQDAGLSSK